MKISPFKLFLLLACTLFVYAAPAIAANTEDTDNWQFNLAPFYLWGLNIDGDLSAGPVTAPVSVSFDDVFDSMEAVFIFHFEPLYKNTWGAIVDFQYLDLEDQAGLPTGNRQNVDLDVTMTEVSGFYRFNHDMHKVDLIAGLRYLDLDNTVSIVGGPVLLDDNQDWLDPIIGGRWLWDFADSWSLVARGDIGGFGIGSEFSWHLLGLIEWQPWKHASFLAGYRALDVDYEDGSGRDYFNFDATVHGPVIGLNFKW